MRSRGALLLGAIIGVSGCSASLDADGVESASSAIIGGQPTPSCAFPTAVAYFASGERCSATLVHPKMIMLAAHCIEGVSPTEITFGDTSTFPSVSARRVSIESCHEKGGLAANEDFAYCILGQEVNDVPIVPILYGCEASIMKPGAMAVLVGYGYVGPDAPSPNGAKRSVTLKVDAVTQKTVLVGDATHGACFGDSGGPAYVKLPDGTWRVFGATSGAAGPGSACSAYTEYAYAPYYVPWIEQTSGIDITPCYDADGTWHPDSRCVGFPTNPDVSDGTWAGMCTENVVLSGPSSACGDAIDAAVPVFDARGDVRGAGDALARSDAGEGSSEAGVTSGEGGGAGAAGAGAGEDAAEPAMAATENVEGGCSCRVGGLGLGPETPPMRGLGWAAVALGALARRYRRSSRNQAPGSERLAGPAPKS